MFTWDRNWSVHKSKHDKNKVVMVQLIQSIIYSVISIINHISNRPCTHLFWHTCFTPVMTHLFWHTCYHVCCTVLWAVSAKTVSSSPFIFCDHLWIIQEERADTIEHQKGRSEVVVLNQTTQLVQTFCQELCWPVKCKTKTESYN